MDIKITNDPKEMKNVFPEAWHARIDYFSGLKFPLGFLGVIRTDYLSGCCLLQFDGMLTLFNLWTPPPHRDKGYAQGIVKMAANPAVSKGRIVLARYRNDEANVAKVFANVGYEIVHTGTDKFIIVASRISLGESPP